MILHEVTFSILNIRSGIFCCLCFRCEPADCFSTNLHPEYFRKASRYLDLTVLTHTNFICLFVLQLLWANFYFLKISRQGLIVNEIQLCLSVLRICVQRQILFNVCQVNFAISPSFLGTSCSLCVIYVLHGCMWKGKENKWKEFLIRV